jgi:hypothetical protein
MATQHQADLVVDDDVRLALCRGQARLVAHGGRDPPRSRVVLQVGTDRSVGSAFQQGDAVELEGLAQLVEEGGQRAAAAQHTAGQRGQGLRLGPAPGGVAAAPGGQVHHRADRHGNQEEHDQGEDVLALGDGPLVDRGDEEPVEQQEGGQGGDQGRVEPAHEGDDNDPRQGRAGCRWAARGCLAGR